MGKGGEKRCFKRESDKVTKLEKKEKKITIVKVKKKMKVERIKKKKMREKWELGGKEKNV